MRPAGVVARAVEQDVQAALRWSTQQAMAMPFAVRSGGHDCAGHSTTESLVISLRPMHDVRPVGSRLHLGGGLGFNDRKWALTCDRLAETRLVL